MQNDFLNYYKISAIPFILRIKAENSHPEIEKGQD
jgi:hypothetical protein